MRAEPLKAGAHRAGCGRPALPPAGPLRGPHARHAARRPAAGLARRRRRRGAARRGGVPPPARAAGAASPTARASSRCASSISRAPSATASRAARACAASARSVAVRSGSRWCIPEYRRVGDAGRTARRAPDADLSADRRRRRRAACARWWTARWQAPQFAAPTELLPRRVAGAAAPAAAARGAAVRASPAGGHVARRRCRRPASGAAAPRVRGTARAPALAAASQAAHPGRTRAARCTDAAGLGDASSPRCRCRSPARSSACSPRWRRISRARLPMVRLIQGDVGCGKTVVAAAAAARAVGSGGQAALMAPTELLAEQHWRSLDALVPAAGRHGGAAHRFAARAHAPQRAGRRRAAARCRSPWARTRCSRKA